MRGRPLPGVAHTRSTRLRFTAALTINSWPNVTLAPISSGTRGTVARRAYRVETAHARVRRLETPVEGRGRFGLRAATQGCGHSFRVDIHTHGFRSCCRNDSGATSVLKTGPAASRPRGQLGAVRLIAPEVSFSFSRWRPRTYVLATGLRRRAEMRVRNPQAGGRRGSKQISNLGVLRMMANTLVQCLHRRRCRKKRGRRTWYPPMNRSSNEPEHAR